MYLMDSKTATTLNFYGATKSKFAILTHHKEENVGKNYASAIF